MRVYRVFPHVSSAAPNEPGGVLYVPTQGAGRFDNPPAYRMRYASTSPAGALAEAFGRFPEWTRAMLDGMPALASSHHALAEIELDDSTRICDLNDARRLVELGLRPSDIVARDYVRTQAAAFAIRATGDYDGLSWWSYYDPNWTSVGLWNDTKLGAITIERISLTSPYLLEAARTIHRIVR